jgi:hypothetical protein
VTKVALKDDDQQTPAEWLEDRFDHIWNSYGQVTQAYDPDHGEYTGDTLTYQVRGMRDHSGKMFSFKEDDYLSHDGARITQTGELWELDNDREVITL